MSQNGYLQEIMDKMRALVACGAVRQVDVARDIFRPLSRKEDEIASTQIAQWRTGRRGPNGENALRLKKWVEEQIAVLDLAPESLQQAFREKFSLTETGKLQNK